jgi:predicted ATPase/class 3 adenylate cyclase
LAPREGAQPDFVLPSGTVTLLLADVQGSSRHWEERADQMPALLASMHQAADEAVGRHGGVKPLEQGEGDSFVAAFPRASDAVSAALDIQLALAPSPISLRMGLHTGEPQLRGGANYIGAALNRCARLRDIAHGGQVLLSQTTRDLVVDRLPEQAFLKALGPHRLRDLQRAEQVFQLCHPDLRADFPELRSLDAHPHNLPVQRTSFVGRTAELADLKALMAGTSLLTLTGSGGCGKTRLALHLAAEVAEDFPAGVFVADLSAVSDPAGVAPAVAAAARLPASGPDPLASLIAWLKQERVLLVLDNCEHLVAACAQLVAALLSTCPSLRILATSREALGDPGEVAWRVPSLDFPDPDRPEPIEGLSRHDAVRLFVERARRSRPSFDLTEDNAAAVAELCRRLDGIPLAIELAAARTRVLSPAQILSGLHRRFALLTGGARTAVPRQATLEASVAWSHDLLTGAERVVFARLAVFPSSFTLDAAEAVCANDHVQPHQVLDLITLLCDKSLLQADADGEQARYWLLETIRQYASARLADAGEEEDTRRRHRDFYLGLAEELEPRLLGPGDQAHDRLQAEMDNVSAAFWWSAERRDADEVCAWRGRPCGSETTKPRRTHGMRAGAHPSATR